LKIKINGLVFLKLMGAGSNGYGAGSRCP